MVVERSGFGWRGRRNKKAYVACGITYKQNARQNVWLSKFRLRKSSCVVVQNTKDVKDANPCTKWLLSCEVFLG